jgi:aerobic carbon-monoxide dehydrogenase large subunit
MREFGIGQSVPRTEDLRLVRGKGRYTDDILVHGCARMYVVRSNHGFARIRAIDTEAAAASPGVLAVLTGADAAADGLGGFSSMVRRTGPDGEPNFEPPFPVLAHELARYAGEGVAIVVAETLNQAKSAAELIEIDYEALDCVSDLVRAEAPSAPVVWEECPGNLCIVTELGKSAATDQAFAAAHHIAKVDFVISRVHAAPMEPRNAIGEWDLAEQRFTLHAGVQNPHMVRTDLAARVFKLPEHQLRVIAPDVGGGFGLKGMLHPELALVLWAARRVDRPVRWTAERSESFLADCHSRDNLIHSELALDADGIFLGLRVRSKVNLGAYLSTAGVHCGVGNLGGLSGVYKLPAIHIEVRCLFTNTVPLGAYRGAGRPEASMMIERVIDVAAHEMGIDAAELRRRNLIPEKAMPFDTGFVFTYDSGDFPTSQAKVQEMARWDEFETRRAEARAHGRLRGIGMAHVIEIAAGQLDEMAEIEIDTNGAVLLTVGTHNHGQGHETTYRQLLSEFLHVEPSRVRFRNGDTDQLPYGFGTGGSRSAVVAGFMLEKIAAKVIAKAKRIAASVLGADPERIDYREGLFTTRDSNASVSLEDVAKLAYQPANLPDGVESGLSHREMIRLPGPTFPNGCHICEIEIDAETGQTEIIGYWVCEDVGKAINPMIVKGQMHGGVAQGIGQALGEYIHYDEEGQLLTGSFMDYQMPRALDIPYIHTASNDVPSRNNPLGIKGAGESGTVGALPATVNAICDALWPLGITNFDMPATPFRVWRAIEEAGGIAAVMPQKESA